MHLIEKLVISELPKVSLNEFYSGKHWTFRSEMKDIYKIKIRQKLKRKLPIYSKRLRYHVNYFFLFKSHPLDATNCSAMIKLIEDALFENDNYKTVRKFSCSSDKGNFDHVIIEVYETE